MFYVYVLRSLKDGKLYKGSYQDVQKRLEEHNAGKTESTKRRRPFVLIHTEEYVTRAHAERREKYLKSGVGREELNKILQSAPWSLVLGGKIGKRFGIR